MAQLRTKTKFIKTPGEETKLVSETTQFNNFPISQKNKKFLFKKRWENKVFFKFRINSLITVLFGQVIFEDNVWMSEVQY